MILITTVGKVGSEAARLLAQREEPVRVLVRDGSFGSSAGDGRVGMIDTRDAAAAVDAEIAVAHADHAGKTTPASTHMWDSAPRPSRPAA